MQGGSLHCFFGVVEDLQFVIAFASFEQRKGLQPTPYKPDAVSTRLAFRQQSSRPNSAGGPSRGGTSTAYFGWGGSVADYVRACFLEEEFSRLQTHRLEASSCVSTKKIVSWVYHDLLACLACFCFVKHGKSLCLTREKRRGCYRQGGIFSFARKRLPLLLFATSQFTRPVRET